MRKQSPSGQQLFIPGMHALAMKKSDTPGAKRSTEEEDQQKALIEWRDTYAPSLEDLRRLVMIPNGAGMLPGVGGQAKAMGLTKGVWDLFLAVPIPPFGGLWIEMKSAKGVLSEAQVEWQVGGWGYQHYVARSWTDAAEAVLEYLDVDRAHAAWSFAGNRPGTRARAGGAPSDPTPDQGPTVVGPEE